MKIRLEYIFLSVLCAFMFAFGFSVLSSNKDTIEVNSELANGNLSNEKIGWGIKREQNHKQPNLGKTNQELMNQYNGIAIGNDTDKYLYLTFDNGYEAGYTKKILEILKNNDVTATFFLTAHYVNTQQELVKEMIDNGNIIGNQFPNTLRTRK